MTIPIGKKDIFDKMDKSKQTIAESINESDKTEIKSLIRQFIAHRDARGNWQIPNKQGRELLVYFKKYVDPNATDRLFGCGSCAKKVVNYMYDIFKIWQNQTK